MVELTKEQKWQDEIERFLSEVRVFLGERFGNGDSWENIPKEMWQETYQVIYNLLSKKYRKDCDGDSQVEFELVDRSRGRFLYSFITGAYPHQIETLEEVDREIENAVATLEQATIRLQALTSTRKRIQRDLEKENKGE